MRHIQSSIPRDDCLNDSLDSAGMNRNLYTIRLPKAFDELAIWTHASTFTFRREGKFGRPCTHYSMSSAVRHFLRVLNIKCLGRKKFDEGLRIHAIWSFGHGPSGSHPHCHMALAAPKETNFSDFKKIIEMAASQTVCFNRQLDIKEYFSEGWISYLLDHQKDLFFDLPYPTHTKDV